jgi:hypothetical protein
MDRQVAAGKGQRERRRLAADPGDLSYRDENGEVLFEVVRFDTSDPLKRFRQRRPDGKGDWIWDV